MQILILEDDHDTRETLAAYLELRGHQVRRASTAVGALAVLAAQPIDALVADLVMSGIGGVRFLEEVRAVHPELPVAVTTGLDGAAEKFAADPKTRVFRKPYEAPDVEGALAEMGGG